MGPIVTASDNKAVRDAQVFMGSMTSKPIVPDGWWGTYSMSVYDSLSAASKVAVNAIFAANGTTAQRVRTAFAALKASDPNAKDAAKAARSGSKPAPAREGVVGMIIANAKSNNIEGASLVNLLANIEVESNFISARENHNYRNPASAREKIKALSKMSDSEIAALVARGKEAFFEVAYGMNTDVGKRLGNTAPGDGGKYYGRGFLQITGKWNYGAFQKYSGVEALNDPDSLLLEANAVKAAVWYWKTFVVKTNKDRSIELSAVAVNGGRNGLDARIVAARKYEAFLA